MNTLAVTLLYRPLRIGWCVADADIASFRQAVRLSFTMWGGRYNPIIPTSNAELAHALVRLFRVDMLINVSNTPEIAAFIDAYKHLPSPLLHQELFVPAIAGGKKALIADISHPIARIWRDVYKENVPAEPGLDVYQWDEDDPLADMFACVFGALPSFEEIGIDYAGMAEMACLGVPNIIPRDAQVPPFNSGRETIATLNRAFVEKHYAVRNNWDHPGFYVGQADNFLDLIHFWNLRAAAIPVQFHDARYTDRLTCHRAPFIEHIRQAQPTPDGRGSVTIWHRSDGAVDTDLTMFGQDASDANVDDVIWNGLNVRAPIMYFGEDQVLASVGESHGKTSISFPVSAKPFVETHDNYDQHFVLSVDPAGAGLQNDRVTLQTPFIPKLNEYYGRNLYFRWNFARAEPESVGIVRSISDRSLTLTALGVTGLIAEIFATVGIAATPSKSGLVAATLMQQMGGLDSCRVFKIAGVRALIENHRPEQSFDRATAAQTILATGSARPLTHYQSLYIEYRKPGVRLTKDAVLAYLLDRGVFRAGLKFNCPNCQLEFWLSLDDARSHLECEYCGHGFNAAPQLRDKAWAFRRSGLFGRDDHQEGAIPVVLALQQLINMSRPDGAIFTSAMKLEPKGAAVRRCETDFIVVGTTGPDHRIDIVIGECKTRKPITADDVSNLKTVADAFPSDIYNVYVVFARLTPFSDEEIELIKTVNRGPQEQRAILMTERELEPYFLYEETAKEFDISEIAASFADMTTVTDRVFFRDMRREPIGPNNA